MNQLISLTKQVYVSLQQYCFQLCAAAAIFTVVQVWDIWNNRDVLAPHWEHSLQVQHPDVRLLISAVAASS
jgi:hypothetical protein